MLREFQSDEKCIFYKNYQRRIEVYVNTKWQNDLEPNKYQPKEHLSVNRHLRGTQKQAIQNRSWKPGILRM